MYVSKLTTVVWGTVITSFAFFVDKIDITVVEAVNKIGSAFYGPIAAAFIAGILLKRINSSGIFTGIIAGVSFNVYLWLAQPGIYWMWWNLVGFALTIAVAVAASFFRPPPAAAVPKTTALSLGELRSGERQWRPYYIFLAIYFVFMLLVMYGVSQLGV